MRRHSDKKIWQNCKTPDYLLKTEKEFKVDYYIIFLIRNKQNVSFGLSHCVRWRSVSNFPVDFK